MFFQAAKAFSAQKSGAEILFLALTQILTVVVVGALVSKFGYYVSESDSSKSGAKQDRRRSLLEAQPSARYVLSGSRLHRTGFANGAHSNLDRLWTHHNVGC